MGGWEEEREGEGLGLWLWLATRWLATRSLRAFFSRTVNHHPLCSKTMEAILAGQVGEGGAPVCVHAKISPGVGTVTVTVRSADHNLSTVMSQHISGILSS